MVEVDPERSRAHQRSFFGKAEENAARILVIALLAVAVVYVAFALTPSHYAIGLHYLGAEDARPLLLSARPIRSDEWGVLTPLFQTAVRGGFAVFNQISPYHESLKGFWALPILDWSLVFKPQLWGFWVLPPAYAYSFYFAVLWTAFLAGYAILFTQLGVNIWIAALGAVCFFFSAFVQVWWTSNAPTFAFAPWPLIVFLLPIRPWLKLPLLFWASAVWVLGLVYPAFMIPAAFALAVLLFAFRRDAVTLANFAVAIVALAALGAVFVLYFGDLIGTMQDTVYPGQRRMSGGGVEETKLLSHLFPFFTTIQFVPLLTNSNECEIAVVSTLLPMTMLCFINYRSLLHALEENFISFWIAAAGLILMLIWMIIPVPASVGQILLWTQVSPTRMLWGFGLLLTTTLIVLAAKCSFVLSPWRLFVFAGGMIAAWLASKIGFTQVWSQMDMTAWEALRSSWFDWAVVLPFLAAAALVWKYRTLQAFNGQVLFGAAAIAGMITYGTFNPVQRAFPIFDIPDTPFLASVREQAETSPNGWAAMPGWYASLFSGAGIPAINHTLTAPAMDFFRKIYPDMGNEEFDYLFNRYAHISLEDVPAPETRADVLVLPISQFLSSGGNENDARDNEGQSRQEEARNLFPE